MQTLIKKKEAEAQFGLGSLYNNGYGVNVDYHALLSWHLKPAEQVYLSAQYNIGVFYAHGYGVDVDYREALLWYLKPARQGHLKAQYRIGQFFHYGNGVYVDYHAALSWYFEATKQGHLDAQNNIGVLYQKLYGIDGNYYKLRDFYLEAAAKGHIRAQCNIGVLYDLGKGVDIDYKVALSWYLKSAGKEYSCAQNDIGLLYQMGEGVDVDYKVAFYWYLKAAEQGDLVAKTNIGGLYQKGHGVKVDYDLALYWYFQAAEKGHLDAEVKFIVLHSYIHGVEQDYNVAKKHIKDADKGVIEQHYINSMIQFKTSAHYNDVETMYKVAERFYYGQGVSKDYKEATHWFTKAAERGYTPAQNFLGHIYRKEYDSSVNYEETEKNGENFNSVELDLDKAFKWYTLSAGAGDKEGQMKLGTMYLNGFGTEINFDVALEWFKKSIGNWFEQELVYIEVVKARKLKSQLLPVIRLRILHLLDPSQTNFPK
ncbi:hypothetical protein HPULCUR_004407 [Helicostylum pulchrum]|uniref:Beta-lactamase n=1 Tax=Helicostylum pulchrum TaxID=562976 RepID=A0ABP9XXJ4_9FUNG